MRGLVNRVGLVVGGVVGGVVSCGFGHTTLDMVADGVWDGDNRMTLSIYVDTEFSAPGFNPTHVITAGFSLEAIGANSTVERVELVEGPGWDGTPFVPVIDAGYDGEGGHVGFGVHQTIFLPFVQPHAPSSLENGPVRLATFEVTLTEVITSETELGWEFGDFFDWRPHGGPSYMLGFFDVYANPNGGPAGESFQLPSSGIDLGSFYIPSPSVVVVLGIGGMAFGGRRR